MERLIKDFNQHPEVEIENPDILRPDFAPAAEKVTISTTYEITPDLFETPPQELKVRYSYIHAPHADNAKLTDRNGFKPRLIELANGQVLVFDPNLPPIVKLDDNTSELVIVNWYELVAQNVVNLDAAAELRRSLANEWTQLPINRETNIALTKNKAFIRIPVSSNSEIIPARTYNREVHIVFDRVTMQCFVIPRLPRQTFYKQADELVIETDLGGKYAEETMLRLQEQINLSYVLGGLTLAQLEQMAFGKQQAES